MRRVLPRVLVPLVLLLGALGIPTPAVATTAVPLSEPVSFTGATSAISRGISSGQTSFGVRTYHDPARGRVALPTFHFDASSFRCSDTACRLDTFDAVGTEIDRLVARRITVSDDLRTATLTPTLLPVTHTTFHFPHRGGGWTTVKKVSLTVSASSTATDVSRYQEVRDEGPGYVLVVKGVHRTSATRVTVGLRTWRTTAGPSEISSTTSQMWPLPA